MELCSLILKTNVLLKGDWVSHDHPVPQWQRIIYVINVYWIFFLVKHCYSTIRVRITCIYWRIYMYILCAFDMDQKSFMMGTVLGKSYLLLTHWAVSLIYDRSSIKLLHIYSNYGLKKSWRGMKVTFLIYQQHSIIERVLEICRALSQAPKSLNKIPQSACIPL